MSPRSKVRAKSARTKRAGRSRVQDAALASLAARLGEPETPPAPAPGPTPIPLDRVTRGALHGLDAGLSGQERRQLRLREIRRKASVRAYYFAIAC